jgi:high-affinity Fe2+/Pb2+ permease
MGTEMSETQQNIMLGCLTLLGLYIIYQRREVYKPYLPNNPLPNWE